MNASDLLTQKRENKALAEAKQSGYFIYLLFYFLLLLIKYLIQIPMHIELRKCPGDTVN